MVIAFVAGQPTGAATLTASAMSAAYSSGLIIDLILAVVALEAVLLAWLRKRFGVGPGLQQVWPTLTSGILLLLSARAALTGAYWGWVGLFLGLAGLSHVLDLYLRSRLPAQHD